jgi:ABC-type multidrug transport system ATPase subunit
MVVEHAFAPPHETTDAPPHEGEAILLYEAVRRYGEREALRSVSTRVQTGETLSVFGPNGAGKTTLLRMLATLLIPHRGTVRVRGHELPRDAHLVRPAIGFLAHDPLLYRDLTGRENLRFYAELYGVATPTQRIATLLDATGMTRRADEPVRNLSRGMAQRLAICRTLLHDPPVLLLDEPRAHLDPEAAALVDPLIGSRSPTTRVLVTHEVEHGLAEADRVLALRDGTVVIDAPARDVTAADVRGVYGGLA